MIIHHHKVVFMQIFYNYTTIAKTNHRTNLLCLFSFIYTRKSNILYLRVSTSGAGWSNGRLGACSQSRTYCEQTITRHEHGALAECEWHREETELCAYLRAVPDGANGRLGACSQSRTFCEQTIARQRGSEHEAQAECEQHRSDKSKLYTKIFLQL